MSISLLALALLGAPGSIQADSVPASLTAFDLQFPTFAPSVVPVSNHLGLVPGNSVRFVVQGGPAAAGGFAVMASAPALAPTPVPLGLGFLELDPASLNVVAVGALDAFGSAEFDFLLPDSLTLGQTLSTQAVTIDAILQARPTNVLEHQITDLTPQLIDYFPKSNHPLAGSERAVLITNQDDWVALYGAHLVPGFAPPSVDFSKHVAVVGFGGHHPTGGYSVAVTGVTPLAGGVLEVQQTVFTPGLGCGLTFSETKPVQMVLFDRVVGGLTVVTTTQTAQAPPCP